MGVQRSSIPGATSPLAITGTWGLPMGLVCSGNQSTDLSLALRLSNRWTNHPVKRGGGGRGGSEGEGGLAGTPLPPRVPLWSMLQMA